MESAGTVEIVVLRTGNGQKEAKVRGGNKKGHLSDLASDQAVILHFARALPHPIPQKSFHRVYKCFIFNHLRYQQYFSTL